MGPALQPVPSRDVLFLCLCSFLLIFFSFFLSLACLRPWGPSWGPDSIQDGNLSHPEYEQVFWGHQCLRRNTFDPSPNLPLGVCRRGEL